MSMKLFAPLVFLLMAAIARAGAETKPAPDMVVEIGKLLTGMTKFLASAPGDDATTADKEKFEKGRDESMKPLFQPLSTQKFTVTAIVFDVVTSQDFMQNTKFADPDVSNIFTNADRVALMTVMVMAPPPIAAKGKPKAKPSPMFVKLWIAGRNSDLEGWKKNQAKTITVKGCLAFGHDDGARMSELTICGTIIPSVKSE